MNTNTVDSLARRPWPAIALMVLLHLGLLLALLQTPPPRADTPLERQPALWLQLLPPPAVAPAVAPAAAPVAAHRSAVSPAEPTPRRMPLPTAAPSVREPTLTIVSPEPTAADPPTTAPPPPPPLNLNLPRGVALPSRPPALDDPRSNSRPLTLERRLAEVMGSSEGPITEEALPDGSLRLRRGNSCAIVRPSRAGALDPFNQSVSPKPRQVDRC